MKYSIVVVTHNSLEHTIRCVEALYQHTKDFELIVVDNASSDGTKGYLSDVSKQYPGMSVIFNDENRSFSAANNQGIAAAKGEYIVALNSDTVVTPEWLDRLTLCLENFDHPKMGMVGPVSNSSAGRQMVGVQDAEQWYAKHRGLWLRAGRLFGWCMLMKKSMLDEIGAFDERFTNSFEDNDLCLRAQLAGYGLAIAYDTYITHVGQATFSKMTDLSGYVANGKDNQKKFYDKYYDPKPRKLVAVYRTNGGAHLEESLRQTSRFADSIILHLCRARANINETRFDALMKQFPKIIHAEFYDGSFQEDYERGRLLEIALKLKSEGKADWCISVDDDELYEDKFIDRVQAMMSPRNPEIFGYWCQWKTIWKRSREKEFFRADSTFGSFSNYRFFRLIPGQKINAHGHPEGHHCGSAPVIAPENLKWSKIRVKHLGYDTPEQRQRKYEFYRDNDHFPDPKDIGNKDYTHLIDEDVELKEYNADNGISLVMIVKNEEENILRCLEHIVNAVDEIVIADTGSTDTTKDIISEFAKYSPVPVKLLDYPWPDNYALARNYAKGFASNKWILHLDADEQFEDRDIAALVKLSEEEVDAYVFHVINYLEKPMAGKDPVYASSDSIRLFRNDIRLYYTGIVHETLDDALAALRRKRKIRLMNSPISLHHLGYLKKSSRVKEKFSAYVKYNEHQIEVTEGADSRPFCSLALHWLQEDKKDMALKSFQTALKIDPYNWHANTQMAAMNLNSAKVFLTNALVTLPEGHEVREQVKSALAFLNKYKYGHYKIDFDKKEAMEKCPLPAKT